VAAADAALAGRAVLGVEVSARGERQDGLDHRDGIEKVRLEQGAEVGVVAFFDGGAVTAAGVVD